MKTRCESCGKKTEDFDLRWDDADICIRCSRELLKENPAAREPTLGKLHGTFGNSSITQVKSIVKGNK